MTWADFYLTCFIAGLAFSVLSVFLGGFRLHGPHFHLHGGHVHTPGVHHGAGAAGHNYGLPHINFGTITVFLAWFGGTGFLLTRYYNVWVVTGLIVAIGAGLAGSCILFFFVAKFLIHKDEVLDPADYDMVGVLGRVSSTIRPDGTGEMIYSQGGTRRAAAVRSEDGVAIPRGAEVVVMRYERGVAWVRHWDDLMPREKQ